MMSRVWGLRSLSPKLLLFFLTSGLALAQQWRILGPGGGGSMFVPAISPHSVDDVMVACDMTGAYVTHDGGGSWRMFNLRGVVREFVFDPVDRNAVYASTGPLWRSTDRGRTWGLVYPDPSSVRIEMTDDHAGARHIGKDGRAARVSAVAVDPADSKTLYAVLNDALHVSTDSGRTWTHLRDGGGTRLWIDPRSPQADRTLYLARWGAVAVRRGGTWTEQKTPADFTGITLGFAPEPILYAVSGAGLHVSEDGGASWRSAGPEGAEFPAIAASLNHGRTAYVSYRRHQGYFGVAKTTDAGRTWQSVWRESREPAPNIHDAWLTPKFGPGWTGAPFNLGVAPNHPEVAYGTDFGRTMRTTDGGKNWYATYSKRVNGGWISTGLDVTTNYGVHFDPFDAKRLFITYTDIGLFRSEDGGESWVASTDGVPRPWVNTTYWMEFDPKVKGRAWAVASGIHDLPRPKMWRRQKVSDYNGGVLVSDDGARTWRVSGGSMPPTAATHILLDPESPAESRTLYVAGFGRGVFKSTDGGRTWDLRNKGIEGAEPFAWRLSRASDGTLYLVVARRSDDGSIGNDRDGALYRSTDRAASWTKVALPAGVNAPNGLTVDPKDDRRLYLSVWRRSIPDADGGGGVYLSTDAGGAWKRVLSADQHVYDVTAGPDALYACGFSSSAWRSTDRGLTWTRIRGYNFKWGHRVIPDPRDRARIFVTTFGGSVWHGPAAGDPAAVEDIATPEVRYSP